MSATSTTEHGTKEEVIDNLSTSETAISNGVDQAKLAALKAKNQAKQGEKMAAKIVAKKERSLNFGVIGSGQSGSNLSSAMFSLGYDAVAINTCLQDLKYLSIPDANKLLLEYGVGGASKELEIGKAAAESHRGEIAQLINEKLSNSQINILCSSLGGGSGAGSLPILIDILTEIGKPIIVLTVLPMENEDAQTKSNALETLSKLATYAQNKKIANLIVVDNAKLESIYSDVSQMEFYTVANKAIVEPLDAFNTYSAMASSSKPLDPMEFSKILIDGEGLSVYGELTVENYTEDTAIAEAVVNNLSGNLLASGFNLAETKYAGVIIAANKEVWSKIPASSVNYAMAMVNDCCSTPKGVFKGIYVSDTTENNVKVYSFFSGLGMPTERTEQLKKDTAELQSKVKNKDEQRNLTLQLDTGKNQTISDAQKVKDKIAAKSSTFGKFVGGGIADRRNK
jgi:cell division GTPase FtsZ